MLLTRPGNNDMKSEKPLWTYSTFRASLYYKGKQFAIVTPNLRDALPPKDIKKLLTALNKKTVRQPK